MDLIYLSIAVAVTALTSGTPVQDSDVAFLDDVLSEFQDEFGLIPDNWKEAIKAAAGKVTGSIKDVLEKAKSIPGKVKDYLKKAVSECRAERDSCKENLKFPANMVCDVKFPACIPAKMSCDPATSAAMAVCGKYIKKCDYNKGSEIDVLLCDIVTTTAMAICTGPAKILSGCLLA